MVRRIMALMLVLCVFPIWGCTENHEAEDLQNPVRFYYKVIAERYGSAEGAIEYELRESAGFETDYSGILEDYLQGPMSDGLVAPFPKATTLISAQLDGGSLRINLSREFGVLSGIDLTVACSCITMTCLELPGVEAVTIRANGRLLNGKDAITLSADSLLLEDLGANSNISSYMLYFSDTDNRYLIAEELQLDIPEEDLPRYLLEQLTLGPDEPGLAQTVPLNTKVRDLAINEGVCNVDLSAEFLDNAPKTELAQRMTILSLTNTLTQLEEIEYLVLHVDGERLERYGVMDLRQPLTFEIGAVGPARVSLNETDADLYLYMGNRQLLSRVPVRVQQSADKLIAEQVLNTLLTYTMQNGYRSAIPEGTVVLDVYLEHDVCVVVLSQELLDAEEDLPLAIRSICATVMAAGDYEAVEIRLDGMEPADTEQDGLYQSVTWDDAWLSESSQ